LEFIVAVLCCGQWVVRWWCGDGLDVKQGVGENVALSRNVLYLCHELGNKILMIELLQ
jgi:hypothetical protein